MRIDAVGRRSTQLLLPCLVFLSTTAPAVAAAAERLHVDTAAVQLTSNENWRRPRIQNKKRNTSSGQDEDADNIFRRSSQSRQRSGQSVRIVYDHPWQWGPYDTTACPTLNDLELSQDECRSITSMDRNLDESLAVHVGNPWPVNSAMIPRGCSERMGDAVPPLIYYNTHPEGAAHSLYRPVCKEAGYSLHVGGCPVGLVGLDMAECQTACSSFKWSAAPTFRFSDARSPKGCYGKAGYYHYNTHARGAHGDPDAFSVCRAGNASAVGDSGSSAARALPEGRARRARHQGGRLRHGLLPVAGRARGAPPQDHYRRGSSRRAPPRASGRARAHQEDLH